MKEQLWPLDIRLLKFIYQHMKMPTIYYLVKKKNYKTVCTVWLQFHKTTKKKKTKKMEKIHDTKFTEVLWAVEHRVTSILYFEGALELNLLLKYVFY